jgi:hypothetical protein
LQSIVTACRESNSTKAKQMMKTAIDSVSGAAPTMLVKIRGRGIY